jgi:hypothetical protein
VKCRSPATQSQGRHQISAERVVRQPSHGSRAVGCGSAGRRATHVTLPSACGRLVRQGVGSHYRRHPAQTTRRKGVPVSTPAQTFLDLAAVGVGLVDLVVVADGLIKAGHTSPEELSEAAAHWDWSGMSCLIARFARCGSRWVAAYFVVARRR